MMEQVATVPLLGNAGRWCELQPHSDLRKRGLVLTLFDPAWYSNEHRLGFERAGKTRSGLPASHRIGELTSLPGSPTHKLKAMKSCLGTWEQGLWRTEAGRSIYVTGSEKRDLNSLFKMRVLQRSVFPQRFMQSKWNTDVLRRRRCCSNDAEMKD